MLFEAHHVNISFDHHNAIDLTVTRTGWEPRGSYSRGYEEKIEYHYPTIGTLRRALVVEKFHTELGNIGRVYSLYQSIGFLYSGITQNYWQMVVAGGVVLTGGYLLHRYVSAHKPEVDSKVQKFNETFPDQKPVNFSFRDYLSARILYA